MFMESTEMGDLQLQSACKTIAFGVTNGNLSKITALASSSESIRNTNAITKEDMTKSASYLFDRIDHLSMNPCYFHPIINSSKLFTSMQATTSSSGITCLDGLFGVGWPCRRIVELVGSSCSGRTSIALSTAITCACIQNKEVWYLDTTNGVSSLVIRDHLLLLTACLLGKAKEATRWSEVPQDVINRLENFSVVAAFDIWSVLTILAHIASLQKPSPAVIVIDCLSSVLAPLEGIPQMTGLVTNLFLQLRMLADRGSVIVITTNSVQTKYNYTRLQGAASLSAPTDNGTDPSAYFLQKGFGSVFLANVDISVMLSRAPQQPQIQLAVIVRPPYYAELPTQCIIKLEDYYRVVSPASGLAT